MEQFDEHPALDEQSPRPTRRESLVPALAVTAVAVVAVAAAVMARHADVAPPEPVIAEAPQPAANQKVDVVHAPPLAPATNRMGGAAACKDCGVVQMVVAVYDKGRVVFVLCVFLLLIRMDDGSVRTIEQRGALAAGSRVVVQGGEVKPVS